MTLLYTPLQFLAIFFLYSALGWGSEVAFAALSEHQLVNRGFLNGPVCPLYGSGMVAILVLLGPWIHNPIVVFFGGMVITTAVEYIAGKLLYWLFGAQWWDYSMYKYNFQGLVCLRFSFFWGIGCLVLVLGIHPVLAGLILRIPQPVLFGSCLFFLLLFTVDLIVSVASAFGLNKRLAQLEDARKALRRGSDLLTNFVGTNVLTADEMFDEQKLQLALAKLQGKENAAEMQRQFLAFQRDAMAKYQAAAQKLEHQRFFGAGHLLRAFPDMTNTAYRDTLAYLKAQAKELAQKAKAPKKGKK